MAADILIHKGTVVPVGDDQLVHLEMARTMVRRFNQLYGEVFPEPQAHQENAVRIPALNGQGKMSKSDAADSYISLYDSGEEIQAKVKRAYSDPERLYKHLPGHPTMEGCNIYHLHHYFTDPQVLSELSVACRNAEIGCVQCKAQLAASMTDIVEPFRARRANLTEDQVRDVLREGQRKALESAQKTIAEVRQAIGLQHF